MAAPRDLGTYVPIRATLADWLVVALLMLAMLASFLDRFALSLLLEPMKRDLALDDVQVGLLNGIAFGLFYAVMGLPLGWLADRWSRRYTIVIGMIAWSTATAGCGLATNFTQLLVARMGVGCGEAGLQPASYGIIHDRFPRHLLGRAMSLLQVGAMVGVGSAMIVAGAVFAFFQSGGGASLPLLGGLAPWQQTFVVIAIPPLLLLPFVARLREDRRIPRAVGHRLSLAAALRHQPVIYGAVFLGMAMVMTATYALLGWVPSILAREFGWSPGDVGAIYGPAVMATGTVGLLGGGWLADILVARQVRGAHWYVMLAAAVAALPLALLLPLTSDARDIVILAAVMQAALAMPIGVAPAYLQLVAPPSTRGQVAALYHLILNVVGFGIGTTLIGFLSNSAGSDAFALRAAVSQVLIGAGIIATTSMAALLIFARPRSDIVPTVR